MKRKGKRENDYGTNERGKKFKHFRVEDLQLS